MKRYERYYMTDTDMTEPDMNRRDEFGEFLSRELGNTRSLPADDGFTDGVMAALPASRAPSPWRDRLIVAIPVLLVGLLVLSQWPLWEVTNQLWQWFLTADLVNLMKTGAAISAATLLAGFGWLARETGLV